MKIIHFLCFAALFLGTSSSYADSFNYSIDDAGTHFSFTTPILIITNTIIDSENIVSGIPPYDWPLDSIELDPVSCKDGFGAPSYACLIISEGHGNSISVYGLTRFDHVGDYYIFPGNPPLISITENNSSIVPESSTSSLFGIGLIGFVVMGSLKKYRLNMQA